MNEPKRCSVCGNEFIPRTANQLYCNVACNIISQNQKSMILNRLKDPDLVRRTAPKPQLPDDGIFNFKRDCTGFIVDYLVQRYEDNRPADVPDYSEDMLRY